MSLQRLKAPEMLALSGPWVTEGHAEREALLSLPEIAVLVPHVEAAHRALQVVQDASAADRMVPLVEALVQVDARHDSYWRAVHHTLQGHIQLALAQHDNERVEALSQLWSDLMPRGLSVVSLSYRDEVGEARSVASRFTEDMAALTETIPMHNMTLRDVMTELFRAADELEALEEERVQVQREASGVSVIGARRTWIRVIDMMRGMLHVVPSGDATIRAIVARIDAVEAESEKSVLLG